MVARSTAMLSLAFLLSGCGETTGGGDIAGASKAAIVIPVAAASTSTPQPTPTPAATATATAMATLPTPDLLAAVVLAIPDTLVASNATIANVHVKLSRAVDRQLAFNYLTSNGTAIEGANFTRTQGTLTFRPGEQDKLISIPIRGISAGRSFTLSVAWTANNPPVGGASGTIMGGDAPTITTDVEAPAYTLLPAAGITGRRQVFTSDFRGTVNPAGGNGVWRTRFDWGRWQSGNKELAPYTDATTDPGTNPHPIVDGYRTLRTEKVPTTDGSHTFGYSASMLSTQGWYSFQYGYVALRAKVNPENGVTPAFWLLPSSGEWPPEIDIFEFFNGGPLSSTVHFKNDPKGGSEGVATGFKSDGQWHTYALDWTPDWLITLVDGVEVHRRRNIFKQPMYIIINTAVGLLSSGPPNAAAQWHNDMTLDSISVYQ